MKACSEKSGLFLFLSSWAIAKNLLLNYAYRKCRVYNRCFTTFSMTIYLMILTPAKKRFTYFLINVISPLPQNP
jgi:hypothetical protein